MRKQFTNNTCVTPDNPLVIHTKPQALQEGAYLQNYTREELIHTCIILQRKVNRLKARAHDLEEYIEHNTH